MTLNKKRQRSELLKSKNKIEKMNKNLIVLFSLIGLLLLPAFAAQGLAWPNTPGGGIVSFPVLTMQILNLMWQIFLVIFFILLFVSAFLFLTAQGDEGKLTTARQALIWAAVSFGIAVLTFSIPGILATMFGL